MSDHCWANLDEVCCCPVRMQRPADTAECDVPLHLQRRYLEDQIAAGPQALTEVVAEYWPDIVRLARSRLLSGYRSYGSTMYGWDDETRRRNIIEELADAVVYLSSEPRRNSA